MVPLNWTDKLLDSLIDRNVFYTLVFLAAIIFSVTPDRREVALGALAVLSFAGGTTKTVMNGLKAKAAIAAQNGSVGGGGVNAVEDQGQG